MSASLTIDQYIQAIAPALAADASKDVFVEMATERCDKGFYGHKYNQAVALMAAHIAFLTGSGNMGAGSGSSEGGSTGSISSKREGDLSVSYGSVSGAFSSNPSDAELSQTRFGMMLVSLRKGCKPFIGVCRGRC